MVADDGRSSEGADTRPGIATADRHVYGPRPVSALLPAVTRAGFRRRSPAAAQIIADWDMIVGPRLAQETIPKRLSGGVLTLTCIGPIALELQHMSGELMARINAHLGVLTVQTLRFEQAVAHAPAAPPIPVAPPEVSAQAEAAVADLPDSELRAALASLGRAVMTDRHIRERSTTTRAKS